jgi:hypothetical protein
MGADDRIRGGSDSVTSGRGVLIVRLVIRQRPDVKGPPGSASARFGGGRLIYARSRRWTLSFRSSCPCQTPTVLFSSGVDSHQRSRFASWDVDEANSAGGVVSDECSGDSHRSVVVDRLALGLGESRDAIGDVEPGTLATASMFGSRIFSPVRLVARNWA